MATQENLPKYLERQEATQSAIPESRIQIMAPSWERVTNYYLRDFTDPERQGDNEVWSQDAEFARGMLNDFPADRFLAIGHRSFQNRAVRYLAGQGIRQFVDIGSGALDNHSAQSIADAWSQEQSAAGKQKASDIKVTYVDNDKVAVAHAEIALDQYGDPDKHRMVAADLRQPYTLWRKVLKYGSIDPEQPVGLLVTGTMQREQLDSSGNEIGSQVLGQLRELMPDGSYLALSHMTSEISPDPDERAEAATVISGIRQAYRRARVCNFVERGLSEVEALLGDYTPVGDGWTRAEEWGRQQYMAPSVLPPESFGSSPLIWAGIGQKV